MRKEIEKEIKRLQNEGRHEEARALMILLALKD